MKKNYTLSEFNNLKINLKNWDIVFLYWDLASGKTTLSKFIINNILNVKEDVISPTYTYYNKYLENIYHFDLYRLKNYDEFFAIWWEEILDNSNNICLIEWPNVLEKYYKPTIEIHLKKWLNENQREIEIKYLQKKD